jgi:hypothetical protein
LPIIVIMSEKLMGANPTFKQSMTKRINAATKVSSMIFHLYGRFEYFFWTSSTDICEHKKRVRLN